MPSSSNSKESDDGDYDEIRIKTDYRWVNIKPTDKINEKEVNKLEEIP